jgi:L-asparaginase II
VSGEAEPIRVVVRRAGVVEARHRVHAVAVRDGKVVTAAGDPFLVTFLRSSAKPFQALPLVRARDDLEGEEIAIACASHLADDAQLAAVRSLLAKAEATEDDLECGTNGRPPSRLGHNCSGKHAGMLAACRAHGWPSTGYRLPDHPMQQAILAEVAEAAGVEPGSIATATDGCGVVTFALPLERMAFMFSRLEARDGGPAAAAAMRAHPDLIRGPRASDTRLMKHAAGWTAKGGAEGLLCAVGPDGLGVALKSEDGATRALGPAVAAFLSPLGYELPELAIQRLENSRGERVAEVVTEP